MRANHSFVFQIEIPIVNHDTCQEAYIPLRKKVTKDMICAGEKEGKTRTHMVNLGWTQTAGVGVGEEKWGGRGRRKGKGREKESDGGEKRLGKYRTFGTSSWTSTFWNILPDLQS